MRQVRGLAAASLAVAALAFAPLLRADNPAAAAEARFAGCIATPGACLSSGPTSPSDSELSALVRAYLEAERGLAAKGGRAGVVDDLRVLEQWTALVEALRERQAAARASEPGRASGVASIRSIEPLSGSDTPESGPTLDGCGEFSGTLTSGDYLDADLSPDPGPLTELWISLACPEGLPSRPCQARVEITGAGGPDGRGTGVDVILPEVPVQRFGPLWVFEAPGDDHPGEETLFSVLYNCGAGAGMLVWGSLLNYDTWPADDPPPDSK